MSRATRDPILGWHWTAGPPPGTLRDGRPVVIGEVLRHDGPLVMCESGLHMSARALDALLYAPGSIVHRVQGSADRLAGTDKLVCRERTVLWSVDATVLLDALKRRWALEVAHLWDCPAVTRRYLETGDNSLRAAARAAEAGAAEAWAAAAEAGAAARARHNEQLEAAIMEAHDAQIHP